MKRIFKILAIAFISGIALNACNQPEENYYKISGFAQGTTYNITYQGINDYSVEIDSLLKVFDLSLSTYIDNSIITGINNNIPGIKTDYLFRRVFNVSNDVWKKSGGAFDITLAPVINAWGFGFTKESEITQDLIDSLIGNTGMNKIKLSGDSIIKENPAIQLDGNAIAQGYSVDYISNFLEKNAVSNYLVEIGGELKAKGINPKSKFWRVGVDKPIEDSLAINRELEAIIELKNMSLATSGNYRKFYYKDGIKYSHTINPQTGYPVNHNLLSVTVLTNECIYADAWATAFMVMGFEKTIDYVKTNNSIGVYLIADDLKGGYITYYSDNIKEFLIEETE